MTHLCWKNKKSPKNSVPIVAIIPYNYLKMKYSSSYFRSSYWVVRGDSLKNGTRPITSSPNGSILFMMGIKDNDWSWKQWVRKIYNMAYIKYGMLCWAFKTTIILVSPNGWTKIQKKDATWSVLIGRTKYNGISPSCYRKQQNLYQSDLYSFCGLNHDMHIRH